MGILFKLGEKVRFVGWDENNYWYGKDGIVEYSGDNTVILHIPLLT
jgi:hypothetical protein